MRKIKNKKYLGMGFAVLATGAVAAPLALTFANTSSSQSFSKVKFMGQTFSSKGALLSYISENSDKLVKAAGAGMYNVKIGNDSVDFYSYSNAMDFIKDRISSEAVYLKPGVDSNKLASIGSEAFIETKGTRKYIVYKKYNFQLDRSDKFGKTEHSFTFALLPIETDSDSVKVMLRKKMEDARLEAAKSYIQVHSAYHFNGIYFKSLNDLEQYVVMYKTKLAKPLGMISSTFSSLNTSKGLIKYETSPHLENQSDFINKIKMQATPYYNTAIEGQPPHWVKVNQSNKVEVASSLDENSLEYIDIKSNDDEVTQIADMDATTPNGMLHGNYFIKSGGSIDGVKEKANWSRVTNPQKSTPKEMIDVTILKSIINYALNSKSINNLMDLMGMTTLQMDGETFIQFLSNSKLKAGGKNYLKSVVQLLRTLSKGVRYNHLDSIIAVHSFLINKMIQNHEDSKNIITVARYFDSMMKVMDGLIAPMVLPFLSSKNSLPADYHFDYFSRVFNFYDDNAKGKGINFQNNPFSYYRRLLGHENSDKSSKVNKIYFQMLKASMGMNAIMLSGLKQNQTVFKDWETDTMQKILQKNNSYTLIQNLNFSKTRSNNSLFDFRFKGSANVLEDSKEFISIWKNLKDIDGVLEIDKILPLTKDDIIENANNYILNYQNKVIEQYQNNVKFKIKKTLDKYRNPSKKLVNKTMVAVDHSLAEDYFEKDFNTNIFTMIPLTPGELNVFKSGQTLVTAYEGYNSLKHLIESAIKPLSDRIKDFAVQVGTVVAKVTIAVVTAGASAEQMMAKESLANTKKINIQGSNWAIKGSKSSLSDEFRFAINNPKIKKAFVKDVNSALKSFPRETSENSPSFQFFKKMLFYQPLSIAPYLPSNIQNFINDALDVEISILKNVLPPLSFLMNTIDSFNSSEKQTYKFDGTEDNTSMFWDGGKVDYSWWGLSAKQTYSIKDLKMLVTQDIVSGYSKTASGKYFGNKVYDSLGALKLAAANKIIDNLLTESRDHYLHSSIKRLKWGLPLLGQNDSSTPKYSNINELINNMAVTANKNLISQKLFKTPNGLVTTTDDAFNRSLKYLLGHQKKVLILKLPTVDINNELKHGKKMFELPKPFYEKATVINKNIDNSRYVVLDPNLEILGSTETNKITFIAGHGVKLPAEIAKYKKILKQMTDVSNSHEFSTTEALNRLVGRYAKGLKVESKEVIYEVLNSPDNLFDHPKNIVNNIETYEYLENSWTQNARTIYKINKKDGQIKYFLSKKQAIMELKNKEYTFKTISVDRETIKYKFNGMLFDSINDIYNFILKNSGGQNDKI